MPSIFIFIFFFLENHAMDRTIVFYFYCYFVFFASLEILWVGVTCAAVLMGRRWTIDTHSRKKILRRESVHGNLNHTTTKRPNFRLFQQTKKKMNFYFCIQRK